MIYDARGQLIGANYGSLTDESYDYDLNGNRESVDNSAGSDQDYQTGDYNRLDSNENYSYVYDDEGNLIERWGEGPNFGQRTFYTWDHRNRLIHVSEWNDDHEILVIDYAYDASNQLIYRHADRPFDGGESSRGFVYENGQVVLQFDKDGSGSLGADDLSHRYLWGPAVDQLLADEAAETQWALTDHLGTVRDWIESDGD